MIFRPVGPRMVAYGVGTLLVVLTFIIGVALPSDITFTVAELATLALILIAILVGLHGVGRSYVEATDSGLDILNGYRRHHVEWADMKGVAMNAGAPWPTLVIRDDERVILFAIQGTDGPVAREALTYIRKRIG